MTKTEAKRMTGMPMSQRAVFHVLKHLGPSTADDLVKWYESGRQFLDRGYRYPQQRPSGIRTRLSELVARGVVVDTTDRVYQNGSNRPSKVWRAL